MPPEQFYFANGLPIALVLKQREVEGIPVREQGIGPAQGGVVDLKQSFQDGFPVLQILQPLEKRGSLPEVAKQIAARLLALECCHRWLPPFGSPIGSVGD